MEIKFGHFSQHAVFLNLADINLSIQYIHVHVYVPVGRRN